MDTDPINIVTLIHHLCIENFDRRRRWLLNNSARDKDILSTIFWSYERHFGDGRLFNSNIHYRYTETHFKVRFEVDVWLGVLGTKIIGSYIIFFESTFSDHASPKFSKHQYIIYVSFTISITQSSNTFRKFRTFLSITYNPKIFSTSIYFLIKYHLVVAIEAQC